MERVPCRAQRRDNCIIRYDALTRGFLPAGPELDEDAHARETERQTRPGVLDSVNLVRRGQIDFEPVGLMERARGEVMLLFFFFGFFRVRAGGLLRDAILG